MRTIWKYEFEVADEFGLEMPKGATILTTQIQCNKPVIWTLVDPNEKKELRVFRLIGTGHPAENDGLKYIGTFQLVGGSFIGHLFEKVILQQRKEA